jgi:hypothetical protein
LIFFIRSCNVFSASKRLGTVSKVRRRQSGQYHKFQGTERWLTILLCEVDALIALFFVFEGVCACETPALSQSHKYWMSDAQWVGSPYYTLHLYLYY